jgi:hypothetical protein
MKRLAIFHISRGYRCVTVWDSALGSHERECISRCFPNRALPRRVRYAEIVSYLKVRHGLRAPPYKPTKAEARKFLLRRRVGR